MVNIGDLAVSLTIEPGGNLDDLRKNIDKLLDTDGDLDVDATLPYDIIKKIDYIRSKMDFLLPVMGKSRKNEAQFFAEIMTLVKDLREFRGDLVARLKEMDPNDIRDLIESQDIEIDEDMELREKMEVIDDKLGEYIDYMISRLLKYEDLNIVSEKVENFKNAIRNFIGTAKSDVGLIKTRLNRILELGGEDQTLLEKVLSELNILEKGQYTVFLLKELETIKDVMKAKLDENDFDVFKNTFGDVVNDLPNSKDAKILIENAIKEAYDVEKLEELEREEIGLPDLYNKLDNIDERDTDLTQLINSLMALYLRGENEILENFRIMNLSIPQGELWEKAGEILNAVKDSNEDIKYTLTDLRKEQRPDIQFKVIKNTEEKVREFFNLQKNEVIPKLAEFKTTAGKEAMEQIEEYVKSTGYKMEEMALITGALKGSWERLKKEGLKIKVIPNLYDLLKENVGITEEELDAKLKKYHELSTPEKIADALKDIMEIRTAEITNEVLKNLLEELLKGRDITQKLLTQIANQIDDIEPEDLTRMFGQQEEKRESGINNG